jgi:uncharacterized membrane protein
VNRKKYNQIRVVVAFFVAFVVSNATIRDSYLLAAAGVITGMIFLALVRSKANIKVDEREKAVQEKAANITYAIFAPTLGIGAFLLLVPSTSKLSVFANGEFVYLESLGMVFAYLALFMITIYSISYYFFNKRFGGEGNDE